MIQWMFLLEHLCFCKSCLENVFCESFFLFFFIGHCKPLRGRMECFLRVLVPLCEEWMGFTSPCFVFYFPVRTVSQIQDDCESFRSDCKTNMSCAAAQRKLFFSFFVRTDDLLLFLDGFLMATQHRHSPYLTGNQVLMKLLVKLQERDMKKRVLRQKKKIDSVLA